MTAILNDRELLGLDELLGFYRTNRQQGCTTKDKLIVSQLRDGKAIATKRFTDASCATHRMEGATTFLDILHRLDKKR